MTKKPKSKYLRIEKVKNAKKQSAIKTRPEAVKKSVKAATQPKKASGSILGKMKGTILFESDLISPIDDKWDVNS